MQINSIGVIPTVNGRKNQSNKNIAFGSFRCDSDELRTLEGLQKVFENVPNKPSNKILEKFYAQILALETAFESFGKRLRLILSVEHDGNSPKNIKALIGSLPTTNEPRLNTNVREKVDGDFTGQKLIKGIKNWVISVAPDSYKQLEKI